MAKRKRAHAARRGTKADPERTERAAEEVRGSATSHGGALGAEDGIPARYDTPRERLTRRIFIAVEVVLVLIPLVHLGIAGVLNAGAAAMESLRVMIEQNPAFLVTSIAALLQPFVAYLMRIAYRHYLRDEAGYTAANLVVLLCAEVALQNMVGIVGMAVLLWRIWGRASDDLGPWASSRRVGGVLADISGPLVVFALAALCAYANMRIGV